MITVVLLSGGLDSAVLLAHEAQRGTVRPVYVSVGVAWEAAEQTALARLLKAPAFQEVHAPVRLDVTMRDLYPSSHWAMRGTPPAYDTPDSDVYLPGRNVVLLSKAGILAACVNASRIVLGTLADNPFPDATPEFFAAMGRALSSGLAHALTIEAPLATMHKAEVIRLGHELQVPLADTLSCMNPQVQQAQQVQPVQPVQQVHCGLCSKCRERRDAFAAAGVADPTTYAHVSPR